VTSSPGWTALADECIGRLLAGSADDCVQPRTRDDFARALADDTAFASLVRAARLPRDDAEVFALLCAIELDPARAAAVATAAGDDDPRRLTIGELDRLFGREHRGPLAVAPDAPMSCAALVEVGPGRTWSTRAVGLPARVAWHLAGDDSPDPDLPIGVEWITAPPGADGGDEVVLVVGRDPTRRLQAAVWHTAGTRFLLTSAPASDESWHALVREATLAHAAVAVTVDDVLPATLKHWIDRTPQLAWVVLSNTELGLSSMPQRPWVEVVAPDPLARTDELAEVFAGTDDDLRTRRLSAEQLRLVADSAASVGGHEAAIRRLVSGPIERLARRIRPRVGWDDLVLPPDAKKQLQELTSRYRNRNIVYGQWGVSEFPSPGVIALFSGPSGTGKTTAAEAIAHSLGLDLFKVEVAAVVSKYIGETEKNLEELFSAAAAGDLVLCFDEADSLIGKRSEVKDARDRYANVEVSYLLQRFETYSGFIVMTTNLQQNIDDAFLRRLHARVTFANPSSAERRVMWDKCLAGVPLGDTRLDDIAARFEISGGTIRNAALGAAFSAADASTTVDAITIVRAVRREFQKLGRLCTPEIFGPWYESISDSGVSPAPSHRGQDAGQDVADLSP
jgi:AAA+ superfamily predicted ATPase